jgi:hypothetical protein
VSWSKRGECPDKRTDTNNKANKRKPKKQIVSGHAGFWLKKGESPTNFE